MKSKKNISSAFASKGAAVVFLFLLLLCGYCGFFSLCVFFFFFMCLAIITSLWGKASLKSIEIAMEAPNSGDFPGKNIPVTFKIHNNKWLPVVWLHLSMKEKLDSPVKPITGFTRKFSWMFWHETLEWKTYFQTVKRGVYVLDQVKMESGDGFGLGIVSKDVNFENESIFYVYPSLVPVNTDLFLRQVFEANAGTKGYYEDPTLIKSIREYQVTDSFKKINWRLFAKQQRLQTNVYEMIQPRASFFIIDLESYRIMDEETTQIDQAVMVRKEDLEATLSILASLFLDLEEAGMKCGLFLPEQKPYVLDLKRFTDSQKRTAKELEIGAERKGKLLLPNTITSGRTELLSTLASIDYQGENAFFDQSALMARKGTVGKIYLVTRSVADMGCKYLMPVLEDMNTTFICNKESENSYGLPVISINQIRKEGAS